MTVTNNPEKFYVFGDPYESEYRYRTGWYTRSPDTNNGVIYYKHEEVSNYCIYYATGTRGWQWCPLGSSAGAGPTNLEYPDALSYANSDRAQNGKYTAMEFADQTELDNYKRDTCPPLYVFGPGTSRRAGKYVFHAYNFRQKAYMHVNGTYFIFYGGSRNGWQWNGGTKMNTWAGDGPKIIKDGGDCDDILTYVNNVEGKGGQFTVREHADYMFVGDVDIKFSDLKNKGGIDGDSISISKMRGMSFTDGTSVPSTGVISIKSMFKNKTMG